MQLARMRIRRHHAVVAAAPLVAMAALGVGLASPAGGADHLAVPANNLIVGSGAQVDYNLMQSLDTLFNDSPGCQLIAATSSGTQPLNFGCATTSNPQFPPVSGGITEYGYTENPTNDAAVSEPSIGSSGGLTQLKNQGATGGSGTGLAVADNINYARSSKKTSSTSGLTDVEIAANGDTWFHFTEVGGHPTPSAKVTSLTKAELVAIFTAHTLTTWFTVAPVGGTHAPIKVFSVPKSSGVDSTFKTFLGADPGTTPKNTIVPQNEDASILAEGSTAAADAIVDYSIGTYDGQCKSGAGNCGGSPLPSGDANALGAVTGAKPTQGNILNGSFPIEQLLYNVYSNGSKPTVPEASAATLNYVSEDGFICKPQRTPQGKPITDPNTGVWYHTEIDDAVIAAGFIPLPDGAPASNNTTPFAEGNVSGTNTAYALLSRVVGGKAYGAPYLPWDKPTTAGTGEPLGYCRVFQG